MNKQEIKNLSDEQLNEMLCNHLEIVLAEQILYKRNKEFLYTNCNTIKRRFYHYRDKNKHPRITVCVLHDLKNDIYCRGISLCSFKDQPVKEDGRDRAEDRAIQAFKNERTLERITRQEAIALSLSIPNFAKEISANYKTEFDVEPTKFELRLFNGPEVTSKE